MIVAIAKKAAGENPAEAERLARLFEDHGEQAETSHESTTQHESISQVGQAGSPTYLKLMKWMTPH